MRQLKSYYTEVILVFVFLCCLNVIAVIDGEKNKIMLKENTLQEAGLWRMQ